MLPNKAVSYKYLCSLITKECVAFINDLRGFVDTREHYRLMQSGKRAFLNRHVYISFWMLVVFQMYS